MNRALLLGLMVVGLLGGLASGGTLASFTSSAASPENPFSAGTLEIGAGLAAGSTLSVGNLVPGDLFTAQLTVQNHGSLPQVYAMTTATSGDAPLASALQVTIRTKTLNPCGAQDGAILYGPGSLATAAIGNPAVRNQPGNRTLVPTAREDLCFAVQFPANAAWSLQGKSTAVTFSFLAQQ